jgi:hypothetical protein
VKLQKQIGDTAIEFGVSLSTVIFSFVRPVSVVAKDGRIGEGGKW